MKTTKTKNKKQSFLEGAMTLMIAMALVKILGAVFKIPLGNMIGASGMGYFQTAYDLYLPVYAVALSGLPIAVCRMVASYMAQGNTRDSRTVLKVAQKTFLVTGIVATVLLLAMAYPYLRVIGAKNNDALLSLIVIAPAMLFCCIMSTYRGYYEGLCNMTPTAVSQVIESLGKVIIGIALVFVVKRMGFDQSVQAAAAIFGIMLGTLFGAIYLKFRYVKGGDGITNQMLLDCKVEPQTQKQILKALLVIAVPVVIGSLASQIAGLVDAVTVQKRLNDMVTAEPKMIEALFPNMWQTFLDDETLTTLEAKYDEVPNYLYGCYKGMAFSIFSLVPTITSVLGVSALPAMTTSYSKNDKEATKTTYESVLKITALVSIPAGLGIVALAGPIMNLLYPLRPTDAAVATDALRILGFAVVFGGITMPMTSLLQAVGKERVPVINMVIGACIKIVINYILVRIPAFNISGAAIGTFACYAYIFISEIILLCKYTKVVPNIMATFIKPLIAGALCGFAAWSGYGLMTRFIGEVLSGRIITVVSIVFAALIYFISIVLLKVLTKNDVLMLPKGEKIAKVLEKLKWI